MNKTSFILFDNQDITHLGMKCLLHQLGNTAKIDSACTKKELHTLLLRYPNSLVIFDYSLSDFNDVWELLNTAQRYPTTTWIVFSDELSDEFLNQIYVSSQAIGILLKDAPVEECQLAIDLSLRGERYFNSKMIQNLSGNSKEIQKNDEKKVLSETEQTILRLMSLGKTTKEIASEKNLSFHTINTHRKNIFHKLEVNNLHEATKYALRAGILSIAEYMI
jgi:DNA-binding NarL/FixJ family response regulator